MPSSKSRAVDISASHFRPTAHVAQPAMPTMPTPLPDRLQRNTAMISGLPSIGSVLDGPTRQFQGNRNLPTRRVNLP